MPAFITSRRRGRAWARFAALGLLGLSASASGCSAPEERSAPVPEPTEALRPAAERGPVPAAARVASYAIDARYDEPLHQIAGRVRLSWRNEGPGPVSSLPFHLYMNGFRAADTAWMDQARGQHRATAQDPQAPWGYLELSSVERVGGPSHDGEPAHTALRFAESPEPSLATVWLDAPLPEGEEVQLELSFVTQLPGVFARTGFSGRYVMAGQWFPKIGVRQPDGTWRAHPFTLYSEFYADFGDYDVRLDLPGDLVVGATGIRVSTEAEGTRQRVHYRAEMVHDFAWTAGPDLVEAWDEVDGIRIRSLLPPERRADAPLHFAAQRAALESMQRRFGPYPWSTITLVDPPEGARGAGGMEYPTFYTTSPARPLPPLARALGFDLRLGTFTTIHEFGHQYFQGLLASDEFSQPWLDEGLNTFSNYLVLLDAHGEGEGDPWVARVAGHPVSLQDFARLRLSPRPLMQAIDQPADRFTPLVGDYGSVTYRQTAATLFTLRRLAGDAAFDAAMRTYADRFRFRHPTGADLEATLIEGLGARIELGRTEDGRPIELELASFFEQALRTTRAVDFRVHRVDERAWTPGAGWHRDEEGALVGGDEPLPEPPPEGLPDDQVEGVVVVHRAGEFVIPVEIEVELSDGERQRVLWDGTGRYRVLRWPGRRVRWARVDPRDLLLLEGRRLDNTRYAAGQTPPVTAERSLSYLSEVSALALGGALGP